MEAKLNMQEVEIKTAEKSKTKSEAKKVYSRLGLALFTLLGVCSAIQYLASGIVQGCAQHFNIDLSNYIWIKWLMIIVPMYIIAMPLSMLIMKKIPAEKVSDEKKEKLGAKKFITYLIMCLGTMWVGNVIGNALANVLVSGGGENAIVNMATENSLYKILVICILAPVLEELVFRKQIIDRCGKYGEGVAILFSALAFGLFHTNIYQFFYAFGLGLIFAYVYTRTRNIKYTIVMHVIINFLGSVAAPFFLTLVDTQLLLDLQAGIVNQEAIEQAAGGILAMSLYFIIYGVLTITGIVMVIVKRKQFVTVEAPCEMAKSERFKSVYLNAGFVLFLAISLLITVMNFMGV